LISIYPSKLEGEPLEKHYAESVMTLDKWLSINVKSYERRASPPISIEINGSLIDVDKWACTPFSPDDDVRIYPEPKGLEAATIGIIAAAAAAAVVAAVIFLRPNVKTPGSFDQQGKSLNLARSKGNQVKIGDIIREAAGKNRIYPDYLLPPRHYFENTRIQWAELLLCVGVGEFQIDPGAVKVGETSLASLGNTASYKIFGPGQDLSGETAADWWHPSTEVGSTSTGGAGLTLKSTFAIDEQPTADTFLFSGYQISVPTGAGWFPIGWQPGLIARVEVMYPYTYTSPGNGGATIISGPHVAMINPYVGMPIEITGDNAGSYVVASYQPFEEGGLGEDDTPATMTLNYASGAPANGLQTGNLYSCIGYQGLRYRITSVSDDAVNDDDPKTENHGPSTITVERLTATGTADDEWPGFDTFNSATPVITLDASTFEGDWAGPFAACPEDEVTSTLEIDVFFPQGLVNFNTKKGTKNPFSCTIELQYRDMATLGAWQSVRFTYTNATSDQLGYTERVNLPSSIRPEVRMRRIGQESTSTDKYDRVQWYALKARLNKAPRAYEGVTVMTVYIRGGDQLSAQSESQVSVVATRKLPRLVGGTWTGPVATRDIVPWVGYVAKSIGYVDDDFDLDELERLGKVWSDRRDYFDYAVEDSSTVKECISDALTAGFAEFTLERGKLKPVRDEPRSVYGQMYSPQNMTEPLKRSFTLPSPDDYDGVDIKYTDEKTYADETVKCRLPGDEGNTVKEITLNGVTNRDRAWRIGMRRRREYAYRTKSYNFSTELAALNSGYLSYDVVADDVPGYAQSAILEDFMAMDDMSVLVSSEPLQWQEDQQHVVLLRRPDGSTSGPWPASKLDDYRMTIGDLDFVPDTSWEIEPPHLLFGTMKRSGYPVLITSIEPSEYTADVEAVGYDERVYADDNNVAPEDA